MLFVQALQVDAELRQRPWFKILNKHVGAADQAQQQHLVALIGQVQYH